MIIIRTINIITIIIIIIVIEGWESKCGFVCYFGNMIYLILFSFT